VVIRNITRNRRTNQRCNTQPARDALANVGRTDGLLREIKLPVTWPGQGSGGRRMRWARGIRALSYTNYSEAHQLLPGMPGWQGGGLVLPDDQKERGAGVLVVQLTQRIDGITRAAALGFSRIYHHARVVGESEPRHCQPVLWRTQAACLVPGLTGGNHPQLVKLELLQCGIHQSPVGRMRRVEGAAEHTDAQSARLQTQSLRTKKRRYSASSGVPGPGWF